MITYDEELRAHNARLRGATGVRAGDRVLDVGCGAGQTTRDAARAAAPGRVLGIDVSAPALERARRLTDEEGLDNVAYEQADAQVHPFAAASFDVAISRFGVMFFSDASAAFGTLARALRPGGRVVLLVWQRREDNEWAVAIEDALGGATLDYSDAFSLGDRAVAGDTLVRAGFDAIAFEDVDEPMYFGADTAEALEWVGGFSDVSATLARLDGADRDHALDRLRDTLAAHHSEDRGVLFDSRAWLITAQTPDRAAPRHAKI
jgi:SAM-dependent methyltransferase